ncbi:hypothetical protein [Teredinibacter turnerae]|uniref:hypothetical protein n=1 Tax=Teredinibacter turnerae TaxID=2426 RepID=UPI0005F7BAD4|nr:hypothetical protein [Teredinibacter turnerae]
MSFRRKNYIEVMDNILTGIVGGVTAETHAFPPANGSEAPFTHALEHTPVKNIVAVDGLRNGTAFRFSAGNDYALADDKATLEWLEGGNLPDKGSLIYLSYQLENATTRLNDLHVGSVTRTLAESVGLEISRLYAQLEAVYNAGFINSASGSSLDKVVALLGIERTRAGRFECELEFTRANGTRGSITIPRGTRVLNDSGKVEYETTAETVLQNGQAKARVKARDVENDSSGVDANTLTLMAKPIAGIAQVTNLSAAAIGSEDESDVQLRARAKNFLHGSERATLTAIQEAVVRQGVQADVYEVAGQHGVVEVAPHVDNLSDELLLQVEKAIADVKPAGVKVNLLTEVPPQKIRMRLRIDTNSTLLETELRGIQDSIQQQVSDYFAALPVKENGSVNKVIGLVLGNAGVNDMQILGVTDGSDTPLDFSTGSLGLAGQTTTLDELEIIDPNLPTHLQIVVAAPADAELVDEPAVDSAMVALLAAVNEQNRDGAHAVQQFTYQQLLYLLPLPVVGKPQGNLQTLQANPATVLPTAAGVLPYEVQFIFTQESGLSQTLSGDDALYAITAFERLTFDTITVTELV